jgi:REP element-mobilizing transposase RayT
MAAHSSAVRWGRHSEPGTVYLITTVTQRRSAVFANFELARLVIAELRACDERSTCQTLAFVLMPDHLHWLVQLQGGDFMARYVVRNPVRAGLAKKTGDFPHWDAIWLS